MIMTLMAEGEVVESIIIDDKDAHDMAKYVKEYNEAFEQWFDNANFEEDSEFPSLLEWLDREKNITTAPIYVGVISMVDGYWYT